MNDVDGPDALPYPEESLDNVGKQDIRRHTEALVRAAGSVSAVGARSGKGVEERLNRSIQAEGSFALIKDALGLHRFLNKGMSNVEIEWILLCMAANTLRLQAKIRSERLGIPTWCHLDTADSLDEAV